MNRGDRKEHPNVKAICATERVPHGKTAEQIFEKLSERLSEEKPDESTTRKTPCTAENGGRTGNLLKTQDDSRTRIRNYKTCHGIPSVFDARTREHRHLMGFGYNLIQFKPHVQHKEPCFGKK